LGSEEMCGRLIRNVYGQAGRAYTLPLKNGYYNVACSTITRRTRAAARSGANFSTTKFNFELTPGIARQQRKRVCFASGVMAIQGVRTARRCRSMRRPAGNSRPRGASFPSVNGRAFKRPLGVGYNPLAGHGAAAALRDGVVFRSCHRCARRARSLLFADFPCTSIR